MPGIVETTTYKVETLYVTRDEASRGLHDVEKAAHGAHSATTLLKHALEAVGVTIGIEKAKHALIDFNSEVQNAKISLSTMIQGNFGTNWKTATDSANALYNEFQRFSQLTPVTSQEMLEFGRNVAVATSQAGGSIKDVTTITEQGIVAAKALGMESNYASLELTEMLMGNVSRRMRFAQQILGFAKMNEEQFRKLTGEQRLGVVEKVLNSPAMKNATDAFSTSWSGVLSTLEDKLQLLFGKIGLPLFQALTKEVAGWNKWLDKNQDKIDKFAHTVANGLVDAFRMVKSAFQFIYDHADTFISIGKIWATIKVGQMLGGGLGGLFGGGGAAAGGGSIGKTMGNQILALLASYEIGHGIGDKVNAFSMAASGNDLRSALSEMGVTTTSVDRRFADLVKSSDALSRAMGVAAKQAGGGEYIGASQGLLAERSAQIALLKKLAGERDFKGGSTGSGILYGLTNGALGSISGGAGGIDMNSARVRSMLAAVGLTPEQVQRAGGIEGLMSQVSSQRSVQQGRVQFAGLTGAMALAIAPLIGLSQDHLRAQQTANQLFGQLNRQIASGGSIFNPDFLKSVLETLKGGADLKSQARVNQNITNHIQVEVAAKDPDRWMAELDAKVARKIRAPSQARGAIITAGGM